MPGFLHALAAAPAGAVEEDDIDYSAPTVEDLTPAPAFGSEEQVAALNPDEVTDNRREPKVAYKPSVKYLECFTILTVVIASSVIPHITARLIPNAVLSAWVSQYAFGLACVTLILTVSPVMRRNVRSKSNGTKKMTLMSIIMIIFCGVSWILATH